MKIETFEELDAWKVARKLANLIYDFSKNDFFSRDYGFREQIRKAAVSVMNNLAEGFERGSNKDFIKFVFISKASAGEVRSMLYLALDQGYIDNDQFQSAYKLSVRSSKLCWGLIKYLRKNDDWKTGCVKEDEELYDCNNHDIEQVQRSREAAF